MATFTTVAAALKKHYYLNENTIPDLTFKKSPFLSQIPTETWGGESAEYPIKVAHNQSHSADFATAQANAGAMTMYRWTVPTSGNKKHYTIAQIPGDVIAAMEGRENSYFPAVVSEVDSAFTSAARRLSIDLFRTRWGDIARMSNSGFATPTMTLTRAGDAKNFEPGMQVRLSTSQNAAVLKAGTLTVLSVDIDANTVTFTGNISAGVATAAQNDWVFPAGDREDSATPVARRLVGLETWVPYDRTGLSTPLFGVNRSIHAQRLAGRYLDGSGKRLSESVTEMVTMLGDIGSSPDLVVMSWTNWANLEKELGSQVRYGRVEAKANIGFRSIEFAAGDNPLPVLKDSSCPNDRIWVVRKDAFKLLHLGSKGPIRFLDEDDNKMLRQSSADSYEIRVGGYVELICTSPGECGVINV